MTIRKPDVTINIVPTYQKQINHSQKVLFVGQMTSAGSATSGQLYTEIGNANEQTPLFGAASMLDLGIRAFKKINKQSQVDVIALVDHDTSTAAVGSMSFSGAATADGSFVAEITDGSHQYTVPVIGPIVAIGSVTFTGTAGADGTITVEIGDISHEYAIDIHSGDSADVIGGNLASLINADSSCAVSAINTTGVVALTAKVAGYAGNSILIAVTGTVSGVSYSHINMHNGYDGDTATIIATNLAALINADGTCDTSAIAISNDVNLTAKVAGSAGNSILLAITGSAAGVSYVIIPMGLGTDGAIAASGSIVFTGVPSVAGTYIIDVGSSVNNEYTIEVAAGETLTAIGNSLANAINADTMSPVTAVNTAGSVALTAINKGLEGNFISLRVTNSVTGVSVAVNVMSGGTVNPTLTNIFDVVGANRYQTIVYPESYTVSILSTFLDARFNVDNNILDGIGVICKTDTFANLKSYVNALNDKNLFYILDKKINETYYKGSRILEIDYVKAAEVSAVRSLRLTDGADISRYVITTIGLLDNQGGMSIASLPYFNTTFYNLPLIDPKYDFSDDEIEQLKVAGGSVLGNNMSLNNVIAGEFVTTYKTDAASNLDDTFKYLEYVDTASNVREYFYNNARTRFAQCRLTAGDVEPQRNMANPKIISAYFDELYMDLATTYVLTQRGIDQTTHVEFLAFFKANKTITLDLEKGAAIVTMIVPIVVQFRSLLVEMQIGFSTNS